MPEVDSSAAPKKERKRRPLRDALGAVVYYNRPEDPERLERIKAVLAAGAPKASKLLRWAAGGGLGVIISLWVISDRGPWGLLNRWLERTWSQTDALTVEVKSVTSALRDVAVEQRKANELLGEVLRNQAADQAKPAPRVVAPKPLPGRRP